LLQIDEVIRSGNDGQDKSNDSFVEQLIELAPATEEYNSEELQQTARNLIKVYDDTSLTTLRGIRLHLINHPNLQSRLQRGINTVVEFDCLPLLADEINMPYNQAFVLETRRQRTLAPLSVFDGTACDTQAGDFFIPIGTMEGFP
jgi:cytochrome P450